ncbi:transmembrane protein 135-like isoform X2 [Antedon mediterranea]|uniref:transmembrane protein 135-like isoform X2 n=1 Tax=Antedon mediterranea TaxID=105859 RepID=UPI003AF54A77
MSPVFSKLWVKHSCYELGHTWTPYCSQAALDVGSIAFKQSLQIYLVFYTTSFILRGKWKKVLLTKSFYADLIRSSIFLSTNAFLFIFDVCFFRRVFGGYHYWFGMLTGIPACVIALMIERPNRRGLLALYTANIAAETFFNMLVSRGYARRIKYGEVLLFSLTSAMCMLLFKSKDLLSPDIDSMLKKFVGNEESGNAQKMNSSSTSKKSIELYFPKILQKCVKVIITKLKAEPTHKLCNHTSSCLYSCVASLCRQFGIGYLIQMVFNILKSMMRVNKIPSGLLHSLYHHDNFRLGIFLGLYTAIFKTLCCTFRWFRKTDHPIHGLIAGFAAGLSSVFYRSTTTTLYFLLKILQSVLEPHHIRPSYWSFLLRLTGNKFRQMNRKLLDQMGTHASQLYPDDWPDYDLRFTSLQPQ